MLETVVVISVFVHVCMHAQVHVYDSGVPVRRLLAKGWGVHERKECEVWGVHERKGLGGWRVHVDVERCLCEG